ncbi:MAG TPA: VC0807 family protein [Ktedonobacteraceae bacterium]
MSEQPGPDIGKIRTGLLSGVLPDIIYSVVGPLLVYRLLSPHLPDSYALLLASALPLFRIGSGLLRHRGLNLLSIFSLLTIALKIFIALVFQDSRLILVSDSLITGVIGFLMLISLFSAKPLLLRIIESVLVNAPSAQNQQVMKRLQETSVRSRFTLITVVWGIGLLLECGARLTLALTLSTGQFLMISPIVHYGLLGVLVIWLFLFISLQRRRQRKSLEHAPQQAYEPTRTSF